MNEDDVLYALIGLFLVIGLLYARARSKLRIQGAEESQQLRSDLDALQRIVIRDRLARRNGVPEAREVCASCGVATFTVDRIRHAERCPMRKDAALEAVLSGHTFRLDQSVRGKYSDRKGQVIAYCGGKNIVATGEFKDGFFTTFEADDDDLVADEPAVVR